MTIFGNKWLSATIVKDGDMIKFEDAGEWKESSFKNPDGSKKNQYIIGVSHNGSAYQMSLNKTNRDALITAFGNDSEKWVGQDAKIELAMGLIGGVKKTMILLTPVVNMEEL